MHADPVLQSRSVVNDPVNYRKLQVESLGYIGLP